MGARYKQIGDGRPGIVRSRRPSASGAVAGEAAAPHLRTRKVRSDGTQRLRILEVVARLGLAHETEIAAETGIDRGSLAIPLWQLVESGLIEARDGDNYRVARGKR